MRPHPAPLIPYATISPLRLLHNNHPTCCSLFAFDPYRKKWTDDSNMPIELFGNTDVFLTYTNQSTANKSVTSWTGASIACKTTNNNTKAADGTDADDIDAAVEHSSTVTNSPKPNVIPLICVMKIDATAMNNAVPSIFTLQPIGRTNRVIRVSIRSFSFIQRNVIGRAAALQIG